MNKLTKIKFLILFQYIISISIYGQIKYKGLQTNKQIKIAIILPLYLDSIYNNINDNFKLKIKDYKDYLSQGWDFYIGTKTALDSFKNYLVDNNINNQNQIECYYYDIKKIINLKNNELNENFTSINYDLILGLPFKNEVDIIANYAAEKNIPFISAFFPNPMKNVNNKNLILLNPTFNTHIIELIKYLHKQNPKSVIKIITKKADTTNQLLHNLIKSLNSYIFAKKNIIQIFNINGNSTSLNDFKTLGINTNGKNIFLLLTLDKLFTESFFSNISKNYSPNKYNFIIGGPTSWEQNDFINNLKEPNISIVYTRSYLYKKLEDQNKNISNYYISNFYTQPTKMFWLGYEITNVFITKLLHTPTNMFISTLNDSTYNINSNFKFFSKDVYISPQAHISGFIENQFLYFIEKNNNTFKTIGNY